MHTNKTTKILQKKKDEGAHGRPDYRNCTKYRYTNTGMKCIRIGKLYTKHEQTIY